MQNEDAPEELVELMQTAVEVLESDDPISAAMADVDDGIQDECGYGGRGKDGLFHFSFFPIDRDERWELTLDEDGVRDIADGTIKTMAVKVTPYRREPEPPEPPTRGQQMLAALLGRELIVLRPHVNADRFSVILEGVVLDAIDRAPEPHQARAVLDGLIELEGIDEVFGDEADVFAAVAPHLGR